VDSIINQSAFFVLAKGKPGGAERRFFYLYEYYLDKGNTPYLITNSELLNNLSGDKSLNKNVFKVKLNGHKFIAPLRYIFNSLSYIHKNKIKHVHFCVNPSFYSFFMVRILRLLGCSTSVSIVNSIIRSDSDLSSIKQHIWKKTIKSVDVIDMLSPSIRANMYNVFGSSVFQQKKITISSCSFSKRADLIRSEIRSDTNSRNRVYDFIFASRLIEGKGLELLLEALELCDKEGYNFTVAICGNGPLSGKVKGIKLNNIKLIYLDYVKDMQDVLFLSKVALSLQKYENYPSQFLLEALAANCNVISTDVGDTRLLLNKEISTLIENNVSSLKDAMIKASYDTSLKRKSAVNSALEHHSVESFANYIEKIIAEVRA
jgi:glycosyltransferase involved in cell wall biosynthesis